MPDACVAHHCRTGKGVSKGCFVEKIEDSPENDVIGST